ncbi:11927_t:CDS:1, partial [Cetraspora pellucida]
DEEEEEENELIEELCDDLEEVTIEQDEMSVMTEFFNLSMFENDQVLDNDLPQINEEPNSSAEDKWSIDDILYNSL